MSENVSVVIDNSNFLVLGGTLHGQEVDVDFVEGIVHVIDGELYMCQTLDNGSCVVAYSTNNIENYIASSMAFINI